VAVLVPEFVTEQVPVLNHELFGDPIHGLSGRSQSRFKETLLSVLCEDPLDKPWVHLVYHGSKHVIKQLNLELQLRVLFDVFCGQTLIRVENQD
jgi:hypothetical protein